MKKSVRSFTSNFRDILFFGFALCTAFFFAAALPAGAMPLNDTVAFTDSAQQVTQKAGIVERLFPYASISGQNKETVVSSATLPEVASPQANIIVTETDRQGWLATETSAGGATNFIFDSTTPSGVGALQFKTDATPGARANFLHLAPLGTPLSSVTELSYYSKQNVGQVSFADASYQLPVFLCGGTDGFTTLVYEPYQKNGGGPNPPIVPGVFEFQDVDQGMFFSSKSVTCGANSVVAGNGGPPFYSLATLKANFPAAVVYEYGLSISTIANFDVEADLFSFNGTVYDFEPTNKTLVVDKDGQASGTDCNAAGVAFTTIQSAVDAANPGDTVKVCPATYTESVTITKALFVNGAQSGVDARFPRSGGESIVNGIVNPGVGTVVGFYVPPTTKGAVIDGFTIQTLQPGSAYGAYLQSTTSGNQVRNNIIQNNTFGLYLNSSGAELTVVKHNVFNTNNLPGAAAGNGIYSDQGLSNATIDANNFTGNTNAGMIFVGAAGTQSNLTLSNNVLTGNGNGIYLAHATSTTITGNKISGSLSSQVSIGGGVVGSTITCNSVTSGTTRGFRIADDIGGSPNSSITVNNNNISANPTAGMEVDPAGYTGTLDATNNFWGNANGPTNAGNPGGTGDIVTGPVLLTPFLTAPPACAPVPATLVVDKDGKANATDCSATTAAFTTIQSAVDAAAPGDIIKVCPATYPESVTVSKALTINGAQSGVDARSARSGGESIVNGLSNPGVGTVVGFFVPPTAKGVVIDGFTIQTLQPGSAYGVYLQGATDGNQVLNNIIQNNTFGLYLNSDGASPTVVSHNAFNTNNLPGAAAGNGIYSDQGLSNATIDANNFTGNTNAGMIFVGAAGTQSNLTLSNNVLTGNGNGIYLAHATTTTITGNKISGSLSSQVSIGGGVTGATITCNSVQSGATRGFRIADDIGGSPNSGIAAHSNNISGNPTAGMEVDPAGYTGNLDATNNYWGSFTGPTNPGNPGGTGDIITGPVLFAPFMRLASGCAPGTPPDLAITKTDGVTTAVAGTTITYTIVASNAGPSSVSNARVVDLFPAAITNAQWICAGTGGAVCSAATGNGNIVQLVSMPAGGALTYTVAATISPGATGTLTNTATIATPLGVTDPNPANNTATDTDTIALRSDLVITKTDRVPSAPAGSTVTYAVVALNVGPSNALGSKVVDTLPAEIASATWVCAGAGGGVCGTGAGSGSINQTVDLPVGGSVAYVVSAVIKPEATGTLSNTATVTAAAGVTDPVPGNNSATDTDTLTPPLVFIIDNVSKNEGNTGTTAFVFTVTRLVQVANTASVDYLTIDGSATVAGGDYQETHGTLNFASGEATKTITVLVNGDTVTEPNEFFTVHLFNSSGSTGIRDADGQGLIFNDDGGASPTPTPTPTPVPTPTPNRFEADMNRSISGVPGTGDGDVNVADQIQYQRFLSGADCPSTNEQARLDAAPITTRGDGVLGAADGTAIDAYARHDGATDFDPNTPGWQATPVGGPALLANLQCTPSDAPEMTAAIAAPEPQAATEARVVRVVSRSGARNSDIMVDIEMTAQGNEAGTQFGLHFDPSVLSISSISGVNANPDIRLGAGAPEGTTLNVNASDAANGYIGIGENFSGASATISAIPAGAARIARVRFHVLDGAAYGTSRVDFDNSVISGVTSDVNGILLSARYEGGEVSVSSSRGFTVSGRVTNSDGRGIRGITVTIDDGDGFARTATTSAFGYYTFDDVAAATYMIAVSSRQYRFASRTVDIADNLTDVNFTGLE